MNVAAINEHHKIVLERASRAGSSEMNNHFSIGPLVESFWFFGCSWRELRPRLDCYTYRMENSAGGRSVNLDD